MTEEEERLATIAAQIRMLCAELSTEKLYVVMTMAFQDHDWSTTDRLSDVFIHLTVDKQRLDRDPVRFTLGGNTP